MSEIDMRRRVARWLRKLDAIPIENSANVGTPDINYIGGWIENKWLRRWPKREDSIVTLDHELERVQIMWAEKRIAQGGDSWVLLQDNRTEWLIWPGDEAGNVLGCTTREELIDTAWHYWTKAPEKGLEEWLQSHSVSQRSI